MTSSSLMLPHTLHLIQASPFQKWPAEYGAKIECNAETGDSAQLRIDGILPRLKAGSFETAQKTAVKAIVKWRHSGNDPAVIRGSLMTWQTTDGGTETGYVGGVTDR